VSDPMTVYLALCGVGVVGGVAALVRGLGGYRTGAQISGVATSPIDTLAAGEVRVTGTVEPAEVVLRSPLQNQECVWYRSRVTSSQRDDAIGLQDMIGLHGAGGLYEERGIGFRVRDAGGAIRVFPRGARIDVPNQLDEGTDMFGNAPVGLSPRTATMVPVAGVIDREAAVAELLTVHQPTGDLEALTAAPRGQSRHYTEARIEPGDVITIVGTARPFSDLEDPATADALDGSADPLAAMDDPEIAADIEAARAAGTLEAPDEAWGNAAIPGFGIDRPVREPELDPAAYHPTLATPAEAARIAQTFDLAPDVLVLASARDAPLLIVSGSPGEAVARDQGRFLVGLLGAVVAIGSAVSGAILLTSH
jgi:hypothetical protein